MNVFCTPLPIAQCLFAWGRATFAGGGAGARGGRGLPLGPQSPMAPLLMPLSLLFLLLVVVGQSHGSEYIDEYEGCAAEGFGKETFVCDPTHRLADTTRTKLDNMLKSLKTKIGCECPDGCRRADGTDDFIGILHVSTSKSSPKLQEDVKQEYATAALGNASCDHGLVLVYLKDTQQLATYRGGDSFVLLTDEDMKKLHELAAKGQGESDTLALQFLLANYKDVVENPVHRSESWVPLIGLVAAALIVLFILAVLLALMLMKYCCCCVKNKKDAYQVNTLPSYKTIEPLYVITPPNGHVNHAMSDVIYSTPYSGSPLPFPPPPGSSVPRTPSSSGRNRVHGGSQETPVTRKRDLGARSEPGGSIRREDMYVTPPEGFIPSPGTEIYGTIPRATLSRPPKNTGDPEWLDPNRRQETQTREEIIY